MSPRLRASLAYFAMFGALGALLPYNSLYYLQRGLGYPEIGALISLGALLGLLAGPMWGSLSDRFRGSPLVLAGTAAFAVTGVVLLPLARDFATILGANLLIGVGTAGILPILDARALESSGELRAGWGPLRAWGSAGWVACTFLTGLAVEAWGLGIIFVVAGAGFALAAGLAMGLVPVALPRADRPLREGMLVFATRVLGLFLIGALLANTAMSAGLDFFTPRFNELGAPAGLIGFSWALPAAIEVPTMLAFPALARRIDGSRLLVAGAFFLALRTAVAAIATDPTALVVASGVGGVGYALFTVGGVTFVSSHVPPRLAATGQGIFQGVTIGLSGVIAAAAGGLVAGSLGIAGMFGIAAAIGFTAAAVVALAVLPGSRSRTAAPPGADTTGAMKRQPG